MEVIISWVLVERDQLNVLFNQGIFYGVIYIMSRAIWRQRTASHQWKSLEYFTHNTPLQSAKPDDIRLSLWKYIFDISGRSYLGSMASKCKLTIQDVNERDRHDQDADQHVRHCKWPQEEVCCILQLLLQRHGQNNQNISSYRQKDNHKNQQGWPVLLLHRLLFNPMRRGGRRGGEIESVVSREEALVQAHGGIPRPDHPANEV